MLHHTRGHLEIVVSKNLKLFQMIEPRTLKFDFILDNKSLALVIDLLVEFG